jgi:uncharacterized SAM-binding protein YcdF (DUF218 family)
MNSPQLPSLRRLLPGRTEWARAVALFLGGFTALNLLSEWRWPGFDASLWWIDLRALPRPVAWTLLVAGAVFLGVFASFPVMSQWRRRMTTMLATLLTVAAAGNGVNFYRLLAAGEIRSALPVPMSFLIAAALAFVACEAWRRPTPVVPRANAWRVILATAACLVVFPLAQVVCFGKTDYRRRADAIIVFGARAYADGRPSDALADRVRTACQLYHEGWAKKLILSGGPGDGEIHETESMRRLAVQLGVPAEAILLDPQGLNTRATLANSKVILTRESARRALVVSHFYHLPRVKLAATRDGLEVFTVPARESYFLRQTPSFVAREVVALWVYYLRPLLSSRDLAEAG